jgi:hypothetical protein
MAPDSPPPDYTAKTVKQLRATLATRGFSMPPPRLSEQNDTEFVFPKCQSKLGEYDEWLAGLNSELGHRPGRIYGILTRKSPLTVASKKNRTQGAWA